MYRIEKAPYGVRLIFSGMVSADDMRCWLEDSRRVLPTLTGTFGVFVDMRDLEPIDPEARVVMREGQRFYRRSGMRRSVVIVNWPAVAMQFKRIAWDTGIDENERYISAEQVPGWEGAGLAWLESAVEPEHCDYLVRSLGDRGGPHPVPA